MINKLFKKEHNNATFLEELLKKDFDQQWLVNGLKSELIDINHKDAKGDTFLLKMLKASKFKSAEWLIHHGADVSLKNNDKKTAINIAIEKNNLPIVKGLLDLKKIDVNQKDIDGRSLLQNVVMWGNNKMAKILINYGADINNTDLHDRNVLYDALSFGDHQFLAYLLSLEELKKNHIDTKGNTLFQHPEVIKNDEIAKDLLRAGIDPTIATKENEPYLLQIVLRGEEAEELIDIALNNQANVNNKTNTNKTIITELIAIATKVPVEAKSQKLFLLKIIKKMISFGGDINTLDDNHENTLFNAVREKDFELTSFLLSEKINPNIQNNKGETALSLLIWDGIKNLDLIILLLAFHANPNIKNKENKTLYEVLNEIILHNYGTKVIQNSCIANKIDKDGNYIAIVKELLAHNEEEDLNYYDSKGNPLFFIPLLYEHLPLFKMYINNGLDIHIRNSLNHNIFCEYVLKVFELNKTDSKTCENFQNNISSLLSKKIETNQKDLAGLTILHKIVGTHCSKKLFDILTKVVLFDYTQKDHLGRSVIHSAVWSDNQYVIEKIHSIAPATINIADNYKILPIEYAALLGNQRLVLLFLELNSDIGTSSKIALQAVSKFSPMLKNLKKLKIGIKDKNILHKIEILIDQVEKDFNIKKQ